jgi:hypothetical protein
MPGAGGGGARRWGRRAAAQTAAAAKLPFRVTRYATPSGDPCSPIEETT